MNIRSLIGSSILKIINRIFSRRVNKIKVEIVAVIDESSHYYCLYIYNCNIIYIMIHNHNTNTKENEIMVAYKYSMHSNSKGKLEKEQLEGNISVLGTRLFIYSDELEGYQNKGKLNTLLKEQTEGDTVVVYYCLEQLNPEEEELVYRLLSQEISS